VAAAAGALAAALTQMAAGLTTGRPKYAHVADEMQDAAGRAAALASELSTMVERDAAAYGAVAQAYRLPKGIGNAALTRYGTLQRAIILATESPLAIARASAAVAVLSADIAERGNTNAVADAAVATLLAEAVCRAAALTVRVNVAMLADATIGQRFTEEATDLTKSASEAVARTLGAVERQC
jgi:glutamate formiminotransferase/formiminotetrahydrofolate cyclodeaminase